MRILITGLLLFLAFGLFGQTVRTVGVVYTASAPVHTPSGQGAWIAVDTTSGSWYEWERTTGLWRDAGYRIQLTNTTGAPNYTPSKARGRVALNSGDSLYAYQAGVWNCLNCVAAPDLSGYVEWSDTTTFISTHQDLKDTAAAISGRIPAGLTGGVAGYLLQYTGATTADSIGVYWDASTGRLGIGTTAPESRVSIRSAASSQTIFQINRADSDVASWYFGNQGSKGTLATNNDDLRIGKIVSGVFTVYSTMLSTGLWGFGDNLTTPSASVHIKGKGTTNLTTALLVENSAGTDVFMVRDDAIIRALGYLNLSTNLNVGIGATNDGGSFNSAGLDLLFASTHTSNQCGVFNVYGGNRTNLSGRSGGLIFQNIGFVVASGTGQFKMIEMSPVINQTGTASGAITGIDYNPAITSMLGAHYGLLIRSGKVGFGTAAPVASARVEISSTTEGFLPPRMTTAQRDAIASPADGLMLFCTDCTATDGSTGVSQTYSSSAWRNHY